MTPPSTRPTPRSRAHPRRRLCTALAGTFLAVLGIAVVPAADASTIGTSGANVTHDPSRMMKDGNTYYVYSTGSTVPMKYSTDRKNWKNGPAVFPGGIPSTLRNAVPNYNGNVWAPDVIYRNGLFRLYYSVWGDKTTSAIGLATSPTLNPNAGNYKWTDRGVVVSVNAASQAQAIDPAPFTDAAGNDWLSWGSGYPYAATLPEIFVTRLNNSTGLASGGNTPLLYGHEEGSYVHYRNGYYYLFWNTGGCCSGAASSYVIHVARSTSPTGPFTERSAKFLASGTGRHGPGHMGILSEGGTDYYTYHYYPDSGPSVLGLGTVSWGSDGWPSA